MSPLWIREMNLIIRGEIARPKIDGSGLTLSAVFLKLDSSILASLDLSARVQALI